jgi:hypothetical protein
MVMMVLTESSDSGGIGGGLEEGGGHGEGYSNCPDVKN